MLGKYVQKFCCENISLIENYEQAVNDKTQIWHCHHRLETNLGLSKTELKEQGKYLNVPANELIFLTRSDHMKLHNQGENNPMYGKSFSEETKEKQSDVKKSEKNPMYGKNAEDYMSEAAIKEKRQKQSKAMSKRPWMNNGIIRVRPKTQEEIDYYTSLGYHPGFKLK